MAQAPPQSPEPEAQDPPLLRTHRAQPVDRVVFGVAAVISILILVYGAVSAASFSKTGTTILGWITGSFSWLFVLASAFFVLFSVILAFSRGCR